MPPARRQKKKPRREVAALPAPAREETPSPTRALRARWREAELAAAIDDTTRREPAEFGDIMGLQTYTEGVVEQLQSDIAGMRTSFEARLAASERQMERVEGLLSQLLAEKRRAERPARDRPDVIAPNYPEEEQWLLMDKFENLQFNGNYFDYIDHFYDLKREADPDIFTFVLLRRYWLKPFSLADQREILRGQPKTVSDLCYRTSEL
ncbi:hypothetical protein BCV69DRAFT_301464 [Microstroma glucosiphilum]|uniref:Uncharacterized protein n=1 Tax=Pseudomicrostroma glucosiphilum TaxID=1684307 RepID=A0A316U1L1_9BASI|nr:hypothetical protein BCV69DRAFT_301464 [Pseudomicrostroma glucosiphilum]PWN18333.1 hypothetical protein BCV69DRAFT_301464 [Pseudomicrostroma glucosiphilum]